MKKLFAIITIAYLLLPIACSSQYVVKKMSDYPPKVGTPDRIDYCLMNDSGVTKRININQICEVCGAGVAYASDTALYLATIRYVDSLTATVGGGWGLTGNSGTDPAINFLGTTDRDTLIFKILGVRCAFIGADISQNSFGFNALNQNTTGAGNDAFGRNTLYSNTSGSNNIALGNSSLYSNDDGSQNVAIGALPLNTSGNDNVGIGIGALDANITGSRNVGIGRDAKGTHSDLNDATAIGANAKVNCSQCMVLGDSLISVKVGIGTQTPQTSLHVKGTLRFVTGNQAAGKVLKSDASGNADWQSNNNLPAVKDSVTNLTTGIINLTNNSFHVIIANTNITSQTINFPNGVDGDEIDLKFVRGIISITITGPGTGTIVTFSSVSSGVSINFKNIGGNWY